MSSLGTPLCPSAPKRQSDPPPRSLGVGFVSAIIILYMSEICPRKIRGALVSGYQFCITIGIMLVRWSSYLSFPAFLTPRPPKKASIVNNFTQGMSR